MKYLYFTDIICIIIYTANVIDTNDTFMIEGEKDIIENSRLTSIFSIDINGYSCLTYAGTACKIKQLSELHSFKRSLILQAVPK